MGGGKGGGPAAAAVPVEVAAIERRSVSSFLETNGSLEAENDVQIVARIQGPIVKLVAEEGMRLGFVNEVVPPGELMTAARGWADEILECAPLSVRASKQAALAGLDLGLAEAMKARYEGLTHMLQSEDFAEGPRAFAEKRKPVWKGR